MVREVFSILMDTLFIVNLIFAVIAVFFERRNPATTWAWLIVILILPYIGFILYICLGLEPKKHRAFAEKASEDELFLQDYLDMCAKSEKFPLSQADFTGEGMIPHECGKHLNDLVYMNLFSGNGLFTKDNAVDIYYNGNDKFNQLFEDIKNAKSFIHMQYYIMRNDKIGRKVIAALSKKALEGIEVCLMVDGMGCMGTPRKFYKPLVDAGGKVAVFLPPYFVRINYRNHRKICVIDGKYGYIGGLNIGDEYLGEVKRFGNWRDCHLRISGRGIHMLTLRFIMDWNRYAKKEQKISISERYFLNHANTLETGRSPDGELLAHAVGAGRSPNGELLAHAAGVKMQIVSSGPDTKWASIYNGYVKMITGASKSIYIQTPYFVPDTTILDSLKIAALSGIDVRIMIPANPDHPFVYWAALSYLGELIEAGVKCYQYQNGFVHSKLVAVDSEVSSVGTANLDIRSFKINFEINAFIYDTETTIALENRFLEDIGSCTEIDSAYYANLSAWTRVKESVSRLISPLL